MARPHEIIKNPWKDVWMLHDPFGESPKAYKTRQEAVDARLDRLAEVQAEMARWRKVEFDILYTTAEDKG